MICEKDSGHFDHFSFWLAFVVVTIAGVAACEITCQITKANFRSSAVRHQAGTWMRDDEGVRYFHWNQPEKPEARDDD